MKTAILSSVVGATHATNQRWFSLSSGGFFSASVNGRTTPAPMDGTITNLYVSTNTAVTTGSYTFVLMVNDAPSDLTATISSGTTGSDVINSVDVSAGDLLEWRITPDSSPNPMASVAASAVFESGIPRVAPIFSASSFGAGDYFIPLGGNSNATAEGFGAGVVAVGGNLTAMRINLSAAPGVGKSRVYTLRVNGEDQTGFTITISDAEVSGSVTNTVALSPGDVVSIKLVGSGTPANAHGGIALTWEPTNNGYFPLCSTGNAAFSTTGNRYIPAHGSGLGNQSVEANTPGQPAPSDMTIDMLYAQISDAPTSGKSRTFTLRSNFADTSPALTTTISDSATSNEDISSAPSITAGQILTVSQVPSGSPPSPSTYNRSGMRGYITPSDVARGGGSLSLMGVG